MSTTLSFIYNQAVIFGIREKFEIFRSFSKIDSNSLGILLYFSGDIQLKGLRTYRFHTLFKLFFRLL